MINIQINRYDKGLPLPTGGKFHLKPTREKILEGINIINYDYYFDIPKGYKLKIEPQNSSIWVLDYRCWEDTEGHSYKPIGGLEILLASRYDLSFEEDFNLFEVTLVKEDTEEVSFRFVELNAEGQRVIGGQASKVFKKVN